MGRGEKVSCAHEMSLWRCVRNFSGAWSFVLTLPIAKNSDQTVSFAELIRGW